MNKKILHGLAILSLAFAVLVPTASLAVLNINELTEGVAQEAGYEPATGGGSLAATVGNIIRIALSVLGTVFLVLILYAGFLWMTAAGDEKKTTQAKSIITSSVIGLLIILSAYAITYFVTNSLLEATTAQY